ncbi:MAG: hypothetical protein Tsb006_5600 [Rickettsiaceae bacterium]
MNLKLADALALAQSIEPNERSHQFLLAPPTPYLAYFATLIKKAAICAQDVSVVKGFGAFTGENSAELIKSCGVDYAIIGHSERRTTMLETNVVIKKKIENCINAGITPIVCIGETMEARRNNSFKEFLLEQIQFIPENAHNLILAYEPIWSIGTGIAPRPEEIYEIVELIKNSKHVSLVAKNAQLVYGGSVSSKNFTEITKIKGIGGVLIGSASLNREELQLIVS